MIPRIIIVRIKLEDQKEILLDKDCIVILEKKEKRPVKRVLFYFCELKICERKCKIEVFWSWKHQEQARTTQNKVPVHFLRSFYRRQHYHKYKN